MITVHLTVVSFYNVVCIQYIMHYIYLDWAAKKELFIGIIFYSQEVFNPEKIYEENKSEGVFVEKIESVLTKFIIEDISGDSYAIRKELIYIY